MRAEQAVEHLVGACRRQRIDPHLGEVALPAPAAPVLGSEVDEQQQPRRGDAVQQHFEECLGFGVDPVQILEDQAERLLLRLPDQEPLERIDHGAPALRGREVRPGVAAQPHAQNPEKEGGLRQQLLLGESRQLGDDLVPHPRFVIAGMDVEIAGQEVDQRQIRGGLAIGHRPRLQYQPSLHRRGMDELEEDTGLADAGLAHEGDDLAASGPRVRRRAAQRLDLELTADELRHRARGQRMDPHPGVHALELEDLHRLLDALEGVGAHRAHPDESLRERHGVAAEQDAAGPRERLEPRCDVGRYAVDADVAHLPRLVPHGDHDRAGIDSDAHLERQADVARHLVRAHADRLLHVEGRIARHHRVIFQRQRRTEARHDPVAPVADDDPLVVVDRIRHDLRRSERAGASPPRRRNPG